MSEKSDVEKYFLELSKGMSVADGGSPITLDQPYLSANYRQTVLHRDQYGDTIGIQDFQNHIHQGRERLANPDEIWTFVQVAKVSGILSEKQLAWIRIASSSELLRRRQQINLMLTQI